MSSLSALPALSSIARCALAAAAHPASRRCLHVSSTNAAQTLLMPALSPTMTEGALIKWHVQEGAPFSAGDVLFEVETDKAQLEVDAQDDGILAKVMVAAGTKGVKVNSVIAVVAEEGEDASLLDLSAIASSVPATAVPSEPPAPTTVAPPTPAPSASPAPSPAASAPSARPASSSSAARRHAHIAPAVSRLIHLYDLSPATVTSIPATGPQGRLLKGDVLAYVQFNKLKPRTVTHPPPRPATPPFQPVAFEVPVTSSSSASAASRRASAILSQAQVPCGAAIVVNGAQVTKAKGTAEVHVKVAGVRRVLKPAPAFSLKTKAQELQFYEFLGGGAKAAWAAAPRRDEPSAPRAKQDLLDYLGGVPRADDSRYHTVARVEVAKAAGFASPKESAAAVESVRKALVQTSL